MINLHNHTTWSDGLYPPETLIKAAILGGLTHVGISDHFYTDKLFPSGACVSADRIDAYVAELRDLAARYAGRIEVLVGIEVDWSARTRMRLPRLLERAAQFDYFLFEYVQDEAWAGGTLGSLLSIRVQIPRPVGLAHNDLCVTLIPPYTPQELAGLLAEHAIFVELSTAPATVNYRATDPDHIVLWDALAQSRVRFSVGSDTHAAIDQVADVADAHRFLEGRGLLDRLITHWWDSEFHMWRGGWQ